MLLISLVTMSGGFIPPPPDASNSSNRPLNPSSNESNNTPLSSLTPRQESRLRQHLDERLIQLERDERKQYVTVSNRDSTQNFLVETELSVSEQCFWIFVVTSCPIDTITQSHSSNPTSGTMGVVTDIISPHVYRFDHGIYHFAATCLPLSVQLVRF